MRKNLKTKEDHMQFKEYSSACYNGDTYRGFDSMFEESASFDSEKYGDLREISKTRFDDERDFCP